MSRNKKAVRNFWNEASCGERLLLTEETRSGYLNQSTERYELEPYILDFADFESAKNKDVLEIGVGLGADHQKYAESGARLSGIDLTERAVSHTLKRLNVFDLQSDVRVGDAENLEFQDDSFDMVYSWGVIHHSPDTPRAISEILRVLKVGGDAKVMIYSKYSLVGLMLWLRYGLFSVPPNLSLEKIYSTYLESPGTKAYTVKEARQLFSEFRHVTVSTVLTHGDLLSSGAGQRHEGIVLNIMRSIWPKILVKKFLSGFGLFMLIQAKK